MSEIDVPINYPQLRITTVTAVFEGLKWFEIIVVLGIVFIRNFQPKAHSHRSTIKLFQRSLEIVKSFCK